MTARHGKLALWAYIGFSWAITHTHGATWALLVLGSIVALGVVYSCLDQLKAKS